jgi:hypothetical protein
MMRRANPTRSLDMEYMLLLYASESEGQGLSESQAKERFGAYGAYTESLKKAGLLLSSNRLKPVGTATTVHVNSGKTQVLNGPYAETKEQLGGYYLIDVPDLDAAISWAARCPAASHGTIEVRPIWSM